MGRTVRQAQPSRSMVLQAYHRAERGGRPWRPSCSRVKQMADDAEVGRAYRQANFANLVSALERAYDPPMMHGPTRSEVLNAADKAERGHVPPRIDERTIMAMADAAELGPPLDPAQRFKAQHR